MTWRLTTLSRNNGVVEADRGFSRMPRGNDNRHPVHRCTNTINQRLLFFFRTAFFIDIFPQTRGKREKPNWQNTFPADALCAYPTVSLPVSLSYLRIATGVSLSAGVGNSSLLYVTSQTTKSKMVPYHLLYPFAFPPFPHLRKNRVGGRDRTQLVGLLG